MENRGFVAMHVWQHAWDPSGQPCFHDTSGMAQSMLWPCRSEQSAAELQALQHRWALEPWHIVTSPMAN